LIKQFCGVVLDFFFSLCPLFEEDEEEEDEEDEEEGEKDRFDDTLFLGRLRTTEKCCISPVSSRPSRTRGKVWRRVSISRIQELSCATNSPSSWMLYFICRLSNRNAAMNLLLCVSFLIGMMDPLPLLVAGESVVVALSDSLSIDGTENGEDEERDEE